MSLKFKISVTSRWVIAAAAAFLIALGLYSVGGGSQRRDVAVALTRGDPSRAPPLMMRYGCAGCHTIDGVAGADGKVGPVLNGLRDRVFLAGRVRNTADHLVQWIVSPQSISPGSAMPASGISETEARDVAAFLYMH
jgi:cytochrome c